MTSHSYREVRLAARPQGPLCDEIFEIAEVPIPAPQPGQVLVRTTVNGDECRRCDADALGGGH